MHSVRTLVTLVQRYYGRGQGTHLIENVFRHFVISMSAVIITHTSY